MATAAAALARALAACGLLAASAGAVAHRRRLAATETGAALLSPRFYHAVTAHPLDKRQGVCSAGSHPCS